MEIGNRLADHEAIQVAEEVGKEELSLIPDGKIQTVSTDQEPNYSNLFEGWSYSGTIQFNMDHSRNRT